MFALYFNFRIGFHKISVLEKKEKNKHFNMITDCFFIILRPDHQNNGNFRSWFTHWKALLLFRVLNYSRGELKTKQIKS